MKAAICSQHRGERGHVAAARSGDKGAGDSRPRCFSTR
jgi:hypothetical protein